MTSHKSGCSELKDLIPLYVKGLLPAVQREEIETALKSCPELETEISYWKTVESAYKNISRIMPGPSPRLYQKITERVKKPGLIGRLFPSRRVVFAFAAVQVVLIIMLGGYIVQQKAEYRTMSMPAGHNEYSVQINVIFEDTATESEIREILLKTDGQILYGPSRSGLYRIGYKSREHAESALVTLRSSGSVSMAEKTY